MKETNRIIGLLLVCYFAVSVSGGQGCAPPPLGYGKDYFIHHYLTSSDTIYVENVVATQSNKGFSLDLKVKGNYLFRSPVDGQENTNYYTSSYSRVGYGETHFEMVDLEFKSLAKVFGDTIILGGYNGQDIVKDSLTDEFVGIKDPIVRVDIESTQDYRQGKDVNSFSRISYRAFEKNIAEYLKRENLNSFYGNLLKGYFYEFKSGKEPTVSSKEMDINNFNNRIKIEDYAPSVSTYDPVDSYQFRLSLISAPHKSGNYEFEIIGTTKSGKVLKTKTEPIYLVGENE